MCSARAQTLEGGALALLASQSSQVSRLRGQRAACRKETKWRGLTGTADVQQPSSTRSNVHKHMQREKWQGLLPYNTVHCLLSPYPNMHACTRAHTQARTHAQPCCSNFSCFSQLPCLFDLTPHHYSSLPLLSPPFFLSSSSSTCKYVAREHFVSFVLCFET